MEEFNNEELNQEVIENEVIPVDENVEVVNLEPEDKDYTVQLIAAGAAIFAAAGYGAYQFGKNVAIPGVRKAAHWIGEKFKKETKDIDSETDDFCDDGFDDEPDEESEEKKAK